MAKYYWCALVSHFNGTLMFGIIKSRPVAVSTLREKNQSNYPADALRELLLNACMHRDYQANMPTRFYQFANRIEIIAVR